jgi:hypothetical protein
MAEVSVGVGGTLAKVVKANRREGGGAVSGGDREKEAVVADRERGGVLEEGEVGGVAEPRGAREEGESGSHAVDKGKKVGLGGAKQLPGGSGRQSKCNRGPERRCGRNRVERAKKKSHPQYLAIGEGGL